MKTSKILRAAICALLFNTGATFAVSPIAAPPKVIIDTDFNTIGDDGQVAVMAAQLYAQGTIDLLGFTVASGNEWRDQEVAECLKAVERLGIENRVKVYVGSQYPIMHDYKSFLYEVSLFGPPIDYVGGLIPAQQKRMRSISSSTASIGILTK